VYSHRHYDSDRDLFNRFTGETGIVVNVVEAGADELIERMRAEGEQSSADLLVTVDISRLHRAKTLGLLQPVSSPLLAERIPSHLRDEQGYWYGLTKRARVIVFDKTRTRSAQSALISNYEDLAAPALRGGVLIRSSGNVYNISLLASIIVNEGEEAALAWAQGVVDNMAREPQGNDRDQMKALVAGLGDYAVVNTYYVGLLLNSDDPAEQRRDECGKQAQPPAARGRGSGRLEGRMAGRFAGFSHRKLKGRLGSRRRQAGSVVAGLVGQFQRNGDRAGLQMVRQLEVGVNHCLVLVDGQRIRLELGLPHDVRGVANVRLGPSSRQLEVEFGRDQVLEARCMTLNVPAIVDRDDGGDPHGFPGGVRRQVGDGRNRGLRRRPELAAGNRREQQPGGEKTRDSRSSRGKARRGESIREADGGGGDGRPQRVRRLRSAGQRSAGTIVIHAFR